MEKNKITELYENEKSRGFVNHLIQSYLPISKSTKVWEFKNKKSNHKCNVCGQLLMDIETVFNRVKKSQEFSEDLIKEIKNDIDSNIVKYEDRFMVKHITKGAVLGWTGEKTNTFLCQKCVQELLELVSNGMFIEDKNIIYQVNKLKRSSVFNMFTLNSNLTSSEVNKVKDIQKRVEKSKNKKATFADLGVLQELKKKMESKNNK